MIYIPSLRYYDHCMLVRRILRFSFIFEECIHVSRYARTERKQDICSFRCPCNGNIPLYQGFEEWVGGKLFLQKRPEINIAILFRLLHFVISFRYTI